MRAILALICGLLFTSALTAQEKRSPESLLPADSLFYLRYDGLTPQHKKAYAGSALARAMKEDLGEFAEYLGTLFLQMQGWNADPAQKQFTQKDLDGFLDCLWENGFAASVDVPTKNTPNLVVVFPAGGLKKNRARLFPLLKYAVAIDKKDREQVKLQKIRGRAIYREEAEGGHTFLWQEGDHLVLTIGENPKRLLDVADGERKNLTEMPLFRSVNSFNRHHHDIRGYLDVQKILPLLTAPTPGDDAVARFAEGLTKQFVVGQLGLTGIHNFTFHFGFEGKHQRSTLVLNVVAPEKRAGILKLFSAGIEFDLKKLPPLPPDTASMAVRHVDWVRLHDQFLQWYSFFNLAQAFAESRLPGNAAGELNRILGIDLREDLLAHLEPTTVLWNALSEGPFIMGQAAAIRVKDAGKVQKALDKLNQTLRRFQEQQRPNPAIQAFAVPPPFPGWGGNNLTPVLEKRTYRSVDMYVLTPSPIPLTLALHKGWLLVGVLPQAVKGCIRRFEGKAPTWQPTALVKQAMTVADKNSPKDSKLAAVSVTDPRPVVEVGLALLPTIAALAGGGQVDVSRFPSAHAVNDHLYPGVTIFHDDGKAFRWESHYALWVPDDLTYFWLMGGMGAWSIFDGGGPLFPAPRWRVPAAAPPAPPKVGIAPAGAQPGVREVIEKVPVEVVKKVPYTVIRVVTAKVRTPDGQEKLVSRTVQETAYKDVVYTEYREVRRLVRVPAAVEHKKE